ERRLELGVRDHERTENTVAVRVDAGRHEEQSAERGLLGNPRGDPGRRLLRLAVSDVLDGEHRADAADVADRGEPLLPGEHASPDRLADPLCAPYEPPLLDTVENRDAGL